MLTTKPSWLAFCTALCSSPVFAIDLVPGEVRAPLPGHTALLLTWQQSELGELFRRGQRVPSAPKIDTAQWQVRLGHSFEIGGQPAYTYINLPYARLQSSMPLQPAAEGSGDAAAALAYWPYANRDSGTYLAVAGYLIAPTGSYDSRQALNVGENRYRTAVQTAVQTALSRDVHWMLALDALWHGANEDFGPRRDRLERRPLHTAQSALMWQLTPRYTIALAYFYVTGGETAVNDRWRSDAVQQQRYQLSGTADLAFGRLTLQYGGDLETRNGYFEQDRWTLRYLKRF